ncbi:MAG: hypothetical protein ABI456_07050 [Ktedonobacteraceae bacterium]|nr:hypothetical protein [Chloroflexota bacterium]
MKRRTYTRVALLLPHTPALEAILPLISADPMGNCYTWFTRYGYVDLSFTARDEHPEHRLLVEELPRTAAVAALCARGWPLGQAVHERDQFGHLYRLTLCIGTRLLYLDTFDRERSRLLLEDTTKGMKHINEHA